MSESLEDENSQNGQPDTENQKDNVADTIKEDKLNDESDDIILEDEIEPKQKDKKDKKNQNLFQDQKDQNNENSVNHEEEEEVTYDVEKILNHRTKYKKLQFYLKWEGWSEDDNSWEDFENLNCPEKIVEYRNKVISDTGVDVLSFLSYGQRLLLPDMFKDDPSVYQDIKYKKYPPVKGEKKYKKKDKSAKEKDSKEPKKRKKYKKHKKPKDSKKELPKMPDFEVISPEYQTSNPLVRIDGVFVKDGEIYYKVKRRKLPSETISSKILKVTYPETLASFLNDLFTENE